jgi:lipid-A-disaccharide synthase
MLIAGEASGDLLAAELVEALRPALAEFAGRPTADSQPLHASLAPRFFGAGGPRMAAAGVELAFDLTQHSVIGLWEALKNYVKLRRLLNQLRRLARERQPDAIICIDFSGFNRRLAHAIKKDVRARRNIFFNWNPKLIQYVSPQVWASRPGRADKMAKDIDLLLTIFPFEKAWYAKRVPHLRVEFVGHPIFDRYARRTCATDLPGRNATGDRDLAVEAACDRPGEGKSAVIDRRYNSERAAAEQSPMVVLLPGSRVAEIKRHLPVMLGALRAIRSAKPAVRARMVLPNEKLLQQAKQFAGNSERLEIQSGGLAEALAQATVAIASTGTVTMECAYFGVPTVALYKTSWSTYQIGKRVIRVKFLAMPNLLANEPLFPEFIQREANAENISRAALDLLGDEARRKRVKARLAEVIAGVGGPGASARAAAAIVGLLG